MTPALLVPFAHAGHWAAGLAYFSPVVMIALAVWWTTRAERRADRSR